MYEEAQPVDDKMNRTEKQASSKFGPKKTQLIASAATQKLNLKLLSKSDVRGQNRTNSKLTRLNYQSGNTKNG